MANNTILCINRMAPVLTLLSSLAFSPAIPAQAAGAVIRGNSAGFGGGISFGGSGAHFGNICAFIRDVTITGNTAVNPPGGLNDAWCKNLELWKQGGFTCGRRVRTMQSAGNIPLRDLPAGSHALSARYLGDANYTDSTSDWLIHEVKNQQIYLPMISHSGS